MRRAGSPQRRGCIVLAALVVLRCNAVQDVAPRELEDLAPDFDYSTWFSDATGFPVDPDDFGAYALQPVGPVLYLGFGAGRPAAMDGALLAAVDSAGVRTIAPLDEQGIYAMTAAGETLLVPGADPCCPDGWQSGNFYTFDASRGFIKWRNIPNVVHAWGLWYDAGDGSTYIGTGSHRGDFVSPIGEIWRSDDLGASWERVADERDGTGNYRTYDLMGNQEQLYAIGDRGWSRCVLVTWSPARKTWTPVLDNRWVSCRQRLTLFDGQVIALDSARTALHIAPTRATAHTVDLPFTIEAASVNWAAPVHGILYVLAENGRLMMTQDLRSWDTVIPARRPLLSVQYWPHRDWLVVAELGENGRIMRLTLCGGAPC